MNLIIYITFYQNIKKGAGPIISQPKGSGLPVRKVMIKTYTQGYMHFIHPTTESGMDIHNLLGEAMSYFFPAHLELSRFLGKSKYYCFLKICLPVFRCYSSYRRCKDRKKNNNYQILWKKCGDKQKNKWKNDFIIKRRAPADTIIRQNSSPWRMKYLIYKNINGEETTRLFTTLHLGVFFLITVFLQAFSCQPKILIITLSYRMAATRYCHRSSNP